MPVTEYTSSEIDAKFAALPKPVSVDLSPYAKTVDVQKMIADAKLGTTPPPVDPPPVITPVAGQLFAKDSAWNRVKTNPVFVPGADAVIRARNAWVNDSDFMHRTYINAEMPTGTTFGNITFSLGKSQLDGHTGGSMVKRAPVGMLPSAGSDHVLSIVFDDGSLLDGWQVTRQDDTHLTFGEYVYNDPGYITNGTGFTKIVSLNPWDDDRAGTTVIGCPQMAGTIAERDLTLGLNHALCFASGGAANQLLGPASSGGYSVLPAGGNDIGGSTGPVPQGGLLLIPNDAQMPAGLGAFEKQFFAAGQKYGIYVIDRAGDDLTVYTDGSPKVANALPSLAHLTSILRLARLVRTW